MKRMAFLLISGILLASCASTKETKSTKLEKKVAEAEMIRRAVESRQYVIRLDKILTQGGGRADLVPKNNFFIMNSEIASVSLAYIGRSYFIRPISGINFNGQTTSYKMQSDPEKGLYNIQVEVEAGGNKFDFFLTIGTSGHCDISVNNPRIESTSYRGTLVPLTQVPEPTEDKKDRL